MPSGRMAGAGYLSHFLFSDFYLLIILVTFILYKFNNQTHENQEAAQRSTVYQGWKENCENQEVQWSMAYRSWKKALSISFYPFKVLESQRRFSTMVRPPIV